MFLRFGIRSEKKTMKNCYDMYLKWDILLLADMFVKFRNSRLKNYGPCPSHYLRAPGLSQDGILNMKNVQLELISDAGTYLFFENSKRDKSFFNIFKRYSKANNKYLKSYDPKQESKQIIHLDENNLQG